MKTRLMSRLLALASGVAVGLFFGLIIGFMLENMQAGSWIGALFGVIMGLSVLKMTDRPPRPGSRKAGEDPRAKRDAEPTANMSPANTIDKKES